MRMCQPHWDDLRAAIAAEGLDHLVARSGDSAIAGLVSELETGLRRENFDPLMAANWAIVNRVARDAPAVLFYDGCPLCWAAELHEDFCVDEDCPITRQTFEDWIPSVAAHMRTVYEELL